MIQYLTGNPNSKIISGWTTSPNYHTGVDIIADEVYAVTSGVVLFIGTDVHGYNAVTVQYDATTCLTYGHLHSVEVTVGQIVQRNECVGVATKFVRFEYITTTKESRDDEVVRIGTQSYYKHNPMFVLNGYIDLDPDAGKETQLFTIDPNIQTLFDE